MKVKSLNTQRREVLIVVASFTILIILVLVLFLFSRHLAGKVEGIYSSPKLDSGPTEDAKLEEYQEIIKTIFPDGIPSDSQTETPTQPLTE